MGDSQMFTRDVCDPVGRHAVVFAKCNDTHPVKERTNKALHRSPPHGLLYWSHSLWRTSVNANVRLQGIDRIMEIELLPQAGELRSTVFENEHAGISRSVFFSIMIPITPFSFEGETVETSVRLDFIDFGVTDWRLLSNKSFVFPVNPEEGYIDGSMYLGHAHNPADVTRIAFEGFRESSVEVDFDITFDFTYEGPSKLGKPSFTWRVVLNFDPNNLDATLREFLAPSNRRTKR